MPVRNKDISRPGLVFWDQIRNLEAKLKGSCFGFFEDKLGYVIVSRVDVQ
jgi:hypothetical protein